MFFIFLSLGCLASINAMLPVHPTEKLISILIAGLMFTVAGGLSHG